MGQDWTTTSTTAVVTGSVMTARASYISYLSTFLCLPLQNNWTWMGQILRFIIGDREPEWANLTLFQTKLDKINTTPPPFSRCTCPYSLFNALPLPPHVTSLVSVNQRWMACQRCGQCFLAFSAELQSLNAFLSDSWGGIDPLLKNISEPFSIFKNSTFGVWLSFCPVTWRTTSRAWNKK